MKVLAVVCRKGGVGKTTVSTHIAVQAEKLGLVTAILDLDPQGSSATWGDHRGEGTQPAVIPAQASRLPLLLKRAADQDADLIILDTPPYADVTLAEAAEKADAILIPIRPSPIDMDALPASLKLAKASGKPFYVLLNAAPVQGSEVAEARAALEQAGIQVAPMVLHQRKAYSARMQEGQTAQDFDPEGKAAAEIRSLTLWLCERLGLTPSLASSTKVA